MLFEQIGQEVQQLVEGDVSRDEGMGRHCYLGLGEEVFLLFEFAMQSNRSEDGGLQVLANKCLVWSLGVLPTDEHSFLTSHCSLDLG